MEDKNQSLLAAAERYRNALGTYQQLKAASEEADTRWNELWQKRNDLADALDDVITEHVAARRARRQVGMDLRAHRTAHRYANDQHNANGDALEAAALSGDPEAIIRAGIAYASTRIVVDPLDDFDIAKLIEADKAVEKRMVELYDKKDAAKKALDDADELLKQASKDSEAAKKKREDCWVNEIQPALHMVQVLACQINTAHGYTPARTESERLDLRFMYAPHGNC
jgi:hypothetical protein